MTPLLLIAALAAPPASARDFLSPTEEAVVDWKLDLEAQVRLASAADPEAAARAATMAPVRTRAGTLAMPELPAAHGAVLLAGRLVFGQDTPETRVAIATGIVPRVHEHPALATGLVAAELDPAVRAVLLSGLRRVPGDDAVALLRDALSDRDDRVRLAAIPVVAAHQDGASLLPELRTLLVDPVADTRGQAARALGRLGGPADFDVLLPLLDDSDANVRLRGLSALGRIDAGRLADHPALLPLQQDGDDRVRRAALRAQER